MTPQLKAWLIAVYPMFGAGMLGVVWAFHAGSDYCGNEHRLWHRKVAKVYASVIGGLTLLSLVLAAYATYILYR